MKTTLVTVFAAIAVFTTGCGIGTGEGAKYEGLYTATGNQTLTITGSGQTGNAVITGNRTVAEGLSSELIYADEDCAWPADINGNTATITPNTPCTYVKSGVTYSLTLTNGTITLSDTIITVTMNGTASLNGPGGMIMVTWQSNETLTRASK
ncbi:MAG: hypothetical protein ACJ790_14270 [Myxococcaceae bacterium]